MKTLTKNGVSIYLFDDNKPLTITDTSISVGNPVELIIADCNSNNTILYENVNAPQDWQGWRYLFDGSVWTQNPTYS